MVYKLLYTTRAVRDLNKIDSQITKAIFAKLKQLIVLLNPLTESKKLKGYIIDTYRFQVGDYRVLFRVSKENLLFTVWVIIKVAHRKDIYK